MHVFLAEQDCLSFRSHLVGFVEQTFSLRLPVGCSNTSHVASKIYILSSSFSPGVSVPSTRSTHPSTNNNRPSARFSWLTTRSWISLPSFRSESCRPKILGTPRTPRRVDCFQRKKPNKGERRKGRERERSQQDQCAEEGHAAEREKRRGVEGQRK